MDYSNIVNLSSVESTISISLKFLVYFDKFNLSLNQFEFTRTLR